MKLDGATIAKATGGRLVRDAEAGTLQTDTRALAPGSWFLALTGPRFDGHDFLAAAQGAGAVGCVVARDPGPAWSGGVVVVSDTTRALQDLGRHARAQFAGPVVGLTGSSGKTTTRALIALALSPMGPVHQTSGNLNNHLGVPLTLLATPPEAVVLVLEMGTSAPGEIEFLARIGKPDVRLIVNVGPAHLEELGGLDGVAVEKGALFRTARAGDTCCVNVEDVRVAGLPIPSGARRLTYGEGGDVSLVEVRTDPASLSTHAVFETPEGSVSATIPAPGRHIALDAAGAIAVAVALGVDPRAAAAALGRYEPVGMRMRPVPLDIGATVLNDAYNANPQSMVASLDVLAQMPGRRIAVLGDMLELGPDELTWHREVVQHAVSVGLDRVVLIGERMAAAASTPGPVTHHAHVSELIDDLRGWLTEGDVVLLKGSRGARVEQVLQGLQGDASTGAN